MNSYLMITGAAGGLGSALALECARRGYDLFLTDRSEDGAEFASRLAQTCRVEVRYRACDLTSNAERDTLVEELQAQGLHFWGLINVAGLDYEGAFLERTRVQIRTLLELNVVAAIDMTHAILNLRDHEERFMLINVCSLAAFFPMPFKAAYSATKRLLLNFSLALLEEIRPFGTVMALCPAGLPTTPETMRRIFAQGFWGKMTTMDTAAVARGAIDRALKGRAVYVPGFMNQILQALGSLVPAGVLARNVGKRWRNAQKAPLAPVRRSLDAGEQISG